MKSLINISKVLVVQLLISIAFILLISFLMYRFGIGDSAVRIMIVVSYGVASLVGGIVAGLIYKNKRMFRGMGHGLLFILLLMITMALIEKSSVSVMNCILSVVVSVICGGVGGIISAK